MERSMVATRWVGHDGQELKEQEGYMLFTIEIDLRNDVFSQPFSTHR